MNLDPPHPDPAPKTDPASGAVPPDDESAAADLAAFLSAGPRASGAAKAMAFLGFAIVAVAALAHHFDRFPGEPRPFAERLAGEVRREAENQFDAFIAQTRAHEPPRWPVAAYRRLRGGAMLAAGLALGAGYAFGAAGSNRRRRQAWAAYRALCREMDRLRARLARLEDRHVPKDPGA